MLSFRYSDRILSIKQGINLNTNKTLKFLIIIITSISLCSGVLNKIFPTYLNFPNLTSLLSLQISSFTDFKIWQFLTHIFISPADRGINIIYLINLFFSMMILYRMGQVIINKRGVKQFLSYFLTIGIISGIAAYYTMLFFNSTAYYAGPGNVLYGLMIAFIFLFPNLDFTFLFTSSIKGKKLFPTLIGIMLMINLSNYAYIDFFATITASLASYLYILLFWNLHSPYAFMKKFDTLVINLSNLRFKNIFYSNKLDKYMNHSKIYDINTGELLINEQIFINACLEKISKEGRHSLSIYEKIKLYLYAKKIKKKNNKASVRYKKSRDS